MNDSSVTITINPLPTITAADNAVCKDNPITICGNGGVNYTWVSLDGGLINGASNTPCIDVETDDPGATADEDRRYEVTGTDANGCVGVDTATVTFQYICGLTIRAEGDTICEGDVAQLTSDTSFVTGAITYSWTPTAGLSDPTAANPTVTGLTTTTTYQVIATDAIASDTATATVYVNPLPTANDQTPAAMCEDTQGSGTVAGIDLTTNEAAINGGLVTYDWFGALPPSSPIATPTNVTVSDTQVFYVLVTDNVTGCIDTATVTYTVNPLPTIVAPDVAECYLDDITLNANAGPGANYSWTALGSPSGIIVSGGSTGSPVVRTDVSSPTGDVVRDFEVTVTDGNGCVNKDTVQVTFLLNCGPTVTLAGDTICFGECTDLLAVGANGTGPGTYTYAWDNGIANTDAGPINVCPTTTTTTYQVIITDGNGDQDTTTATVVVNPLPTANDQTPAALCEDTPTGGTVAGVDLTTNEATVNGGIGISYNWIGVGSPGSVTVSNGQVFDVEVIDGNGCKDTATVTYTVNTIGIGAAPNENICDGQSINIGGVPRTVAGVYDVTLPGGAANGCDSMYVTILTVTPKDDASFNYPQTTLCEVDPYPVANVTGLSGGTFSIANGGTIDPSTGQIDTATTGAGTYTVTYTTNGPCVNTSTVSVTIIPKADATIIKGDTVFCQVDPAVTFSTVEPGGTWTGVSNGVFSPTTAGPGVHLITYTIGSGSCRDMDNFNVLVNPNPVISLVKQDDNCLSEEGSVKANISTGTPPYDYAWGAEDPDATITLEGDSAIVNLAAGTYTLTVIDSAGCTSSAMATIEDILENCDFHIFLPNIFSPNGDGKNDVFFVRGKGIKSLHLVIYSRWGEKVFETQDADEGWDGRFRGEDMNPAVFVYYVQATMYTDEVIEQKGNVTLVR